MIHPAIGSWIDNSVNAFTEQVYVATRHPIRYAVSAGLAAIFVGFGIILIFTLGGKFQPEFRPIIMGATFGIALSLVVFSKVDLFTGAVMHATNYLLLNPKSNGRNLVDIYIVLVISFVASWAAAAAFGYLYVHAFGVNEFAHTVALTKMSQTFDQLFIKGVFCNILVCLAVQFAMRAESESGKLIMVWWCLFAFIASGFEHSIANMTVFAIADIPFNDSLFLNMIPVTLGNIVGGMFVALAFKTASGR